MFKPKLSCSVSCITPLGLNDGVFRYELDKNFENNIKKLKELGFDGIELGISGPAYAWVIEKNLKKACKIVDKHGLKIYSVHMPFGEHWMNLVSSYEPDRQAIIKWCGKIFGIVDKYSPNSYVFHPSDMGECKQANYADCLKKLCDSVNEMAKYTKAYVCMENMVGGNLMHSLENMQDYVKGADKGYMVLDVNHTILTPPEEVVKAIGSKIKTLHISDNDGVYERHWLPGEGIIKWQEVISALDGIGYEGMFNYEVGAKYSYEEIKQNYDKLFEEYNKNK